MVLSYICVGNKSDGNGRIAGENYYCKKLKIISQNCHPFSKSSVSIHKETN